jgi:kynurenine 3-monooxygenase
MMKNGRVNYSRQFIDMGYKELRIPPKVDQNGVKHYALDTPNGLHIWPRGKLMLIALPNADRSFTATLFAPYSGPEGFTSLAYDGNDETISRFLHKYFPDVVPVIPHLLHDFKTHPVGSLMTSRVNPWYVGRVLLIGDAAHSILPFLGQGMNAAFEDCYMFYKLLKENDYQLHKSCQLFNKVRLNSVEKLADFSEEHYRDMSVNTASSWYHLRKNIEQFIRRILPRGWFIPQYVMIAFTDIPYDEIKEREETQQTIITVGLSVVSMLMIGLLSQSGVFIWNHRAQLPELANNLPKLFNGVLLALKGGIGKR